MQELVPVSAADDAVGAYEGIRLPLEIIAKIISYLPITEILDIMNHNDSILFCIVQFPIIWNHIDLNQIPEIDLALFRNVTAYGRHIRRLSFGGDVRSLRNDSTLAGLSSTFIEESLSQCANLNILCLAHNTCLNNATFLSSMSKLTTLDLTGCYNIEYHSLVKYISNCPLISSLCISGCDQIVEESILDLSTSLSQLKMFNCEDTVPLTADTFFFDYGKHTN